MRFVALACSALLLLAACGQNTDTPPSSDAVPVQPIAVAAADQLTGLDAPATGIAFWTHPNVAFNSLMIVAGENGVASFNIEDGNEVSRIPGFNADGAAIGYIGFGPQARGLLAYFDANAGAMKIHEIDNAARSFKPVTGDIPIRGAVRGFCFGRAVDAEGPTLVVLQKGELTRYAFRLENATLTAKASVSETAPDDIISCAIDGEDGAVFIARENGAVHRIGADGHGALFASAAAEQPGDLAVLLSEVTTNETSSVNGQVILLDKSNGAMHAFNRDDGAPLGAVTVGEAFEIEAVNSADVMGVAGANLGALYRNGAIALGLTGDAGAGVIRLIPANGLINALGTADGTPLSPRGSMPQSDDDGLLIRTNIQPE
ncbi:MAG: hypothetical protein AAFX54_08025 [Pseudomonadota bacterium]